VRCLRAFVDSALVGHGWEEVGGLLVERVVANVGAAGSWALQGMRWNGAWVLEEGVQLQRR